MIIGSSGGVTFGDQKLNVYSLPGSWLTLSPTTTAGANATSIYRYQGNQPYMTFNTNLALTGTWDWTQWLSNDVPTYQTTNQRLWVDLGATERTIRGIRVVNAHTSGNLTGYGIKDVRVYVLPAAGGPPSNAYNAGSVGADRLVFDGTIQQAQGTGTVGTAGWTPQWQQLDLTAERKGRYVVFDIANGWSSLYFMGVRRIQFRVAP